MTTGGGVTLTSGSDQAQDTETPGQTSSAGAEPAEVSSVAKTWVVITGALLVIWFFFAWLALDRHIVDAAGESVGTAFALLLLVSVIGAVRGSRR